MVLASSIRSGSGRPHPQPPGVPSAAARVEARAIVPAGARGSGGIRARQPRGPQPPGRNDAADGKQRAPAKDRQQRNRDETRERRAERHAHDGDGDRERALPRWDVFGRQRRGVRHRAAEAEARQQAQRSEGGDAVGRGHGDRRHTEDGNTPQQRDSPPNRSPAMPATAPPTIIPSELSANTGANAPRSNRQSRMIEGIDTPSS